MSLRITSLGDSIAKRQQLKNQWIKKPQPQPRQQPQQSQPLKPQPRQPIQSEKQQSRKFEQPQPRQETKSEQPQPQPRQSEQPQPLKSLPRQFEQQPRQETIEYNPRYISEIYGQKKGIDTFVGLVKHGGAFVMLHGPSGCGKSAFVKAYCSENNLQLVDLTTQFIEISDFTPAGLKRKRDDEQDTSVDEKVKRILQQSCFGGTIFSTGKRKLVLIDDAEVFPEHLWKVMTHIGHLIVRKTSTILVVNVNNAYEGLPNKYRKSFTKLIPFYELSFTSVFSLLSGINKKFGIGNNIIKSIASESNGDFRKAMHMMNLTHLVTNFICGGGKTDIRSLHLSMTDNDTNIAKIHLGNFDRFRKCVSSSSTLNDIEAMAMVEPRLMSAFVIQNYPDCSDGDLNMMSEVSNWIACGDSLKQGHHLLTYTTDYNNYLFEIMTCAPLYALSRTKTASSKKAKFPERILKSFVREQKDPLYWSTRGHVTETTKTNVKTELNKLW